MHTSSDMPDVFVQHPSQCMYSTYQRIVHSEPTLFVRNGRKVRRKQNATHRPSQRLHQVFHDNLFCEFPQPHQLRCDQVCNTQNETQITPAVRITQAASSSAAPPLRQRMSILPPSQLTNFPESARERERAVPPPPAPAPPAPEPEVKYVDRVPVE